MRFKELTQLFERLDSTRKRLELTDIVAEFIKETDEYLLPTVCRFVQGRVFPAWSEQELGVAEKLMVKCISTVSGKTEKDIERGIKETGDTGLAAEKILSTKKQTTLYSRTLDVEDVEASLIKLAGLSGKGSQDKKIAYINELLSSAEGVEGKYIVRLILGELRLGVGDGIVRDAIVKAFDVPAEEVERAYYLTSDLGEVAGITKSKGAAGLKKVAMKPGRPIRVMLAQKKQCIQEVVEALGEAAYEIKYDGARVQIHKSGDEVALYTRRLENVTHQFPEIVKSAKEHMKAKQAIIEGEVVAIQMIGDRTPRPFQDLSRRIKRKYDIPEIQKKIPVEVNLFDLLYIEGQSKIDTPFRERRKLLKSIIDETATFRLARQVVTKNPEKAEEFYQFALSQKHEGVMVKVLDAPYQPGSRVGYMYKIKPIMETLDLAVVGATWGEGRRASWLGSYLLAAYDPNTGEYQTIGRMATGLSDEQLAEYTELFKEHVIKESGKDVSIRPQVIFEVAYEEIQKSPTYTSGYALRFPRLVRLRDDKGPQDADTLERVEEILKG
ncbi:MAG: ATP-dependent DNA ligase [Candidatus Altiarchaeota archaeon]